VIAPSEDTSGQLNFERTYLAYDRTLMAWVRTAISLITFGLSFDKLSEYIQDRDPTQAGHHALWPQSLGLAMIAIGVFGLAGAIWQHRESIRRMRTSYDPRRFSLVTAMASLTALLGIAAFVAGLVRW
jgi:putative membrane protein